MIFNQLEFLPVAYFIVLMWVVCATVLAKLFGGMLIEATPGVLQPILSRPVNIRVTGDGIVFHIFEKSLVTDLNTRMAFDLVRDFARLAGGGIFVPAPATPFVLQKILVPEQYWSGCPPNSSYASV